MNFNTSHGSKEAEMSINDLFCVLNSPPALKSENAQQIHRLPPYQERKAFKVDEYAGANENWMHGSDLAGSYFVAVAPEHGLWLDFNKNANHTHHVAIVVSMQGVNPLTGLPLIGEALRMEQYRTKCPKHDIEFKSDRYCEECKYKWVPQNYLSTTGTPHGQLWLDGFVAEDGVVRQYYFTEEECKGIASQIIGDKRVYALGIAFYLSKEKKPVVVSSPLRSGGVQLSGGISYGKNAIHKVDYGQTDAVWAYKSKMKKYHEDMPKLNSFGFCSNHKDDGGATLSCDNRGMIPDCIGADDVAVFKRIGIPEKVLEIGAGAKIDQKIYRDPNELSFWNDTPAGMLYINYVDEGTCKRIISVGKKDLTKGGEGFLAELQVGR